MIPEEFLIPVDELSDEHLATHGEVLFKKWLLEMKANGYIVDAFKIRESRVSGVRRPDFLIRTSTGFAVAEIKERISNSVLDKAYEQTPETELANVTTALEDMNLRDAIASSEAQHQSLKEEFAISDHYERWTVLYVRPGLPSSLSKSRSYHLEAGEWSEESFDSMDHEACVLLYGKYAYRPVGFVDGRVDGQHFIKRDGYFADHRESILNYVGILGKLSEGLPHIRFYPKPRIQELALNTPLELEVSEWLSLFAD